MRIVIPGKPVPKGRPRLGMNGKKAYVYTPPETKQYEQAVGWAAKSKGCKQIKGPVTIQIDIYIAGKADIDNICKSLLDGLNGIAFVDDDQVVGLYVRKHRIKNKGEQRVVLEIFEE